MEEEDGRRGGGGGGGGVEDPWDMSAAEEDMTFGGKRSSRSGRGNNSSRGERKHQQADAFEWDD